MAKAKGSTENREKSLPATGGIRVASPEKPGQTTLVYGVFKVKPKATLPDNSSQFHDRVPPRPVANMFGKRFVVASGSKFDLSEVVWYDTSPKCPVHFSTKRERSKQAAKFDLSDVMRYDLSPKCQVPFSTKSERSKHAAKNVYVKTAEATAVKLRGRDFGDVLELDQDKVQSLDADALDGYGARRAAFYIKKFATD
ncbi:hypothetical protein [Paraburkholderia tropica]|uniref:hypothetical protein n=1 Tax=Paraburkholderia tropica TaxID=92647 RepID=UPI001F198268|nr:hypothetical protein [Paraburkholderia tropica]